MFPEGFPQVGGSIWGAAICHSCRRRGRQVLEGCHCWIQLPGGGWCLFCDCLLGGNISHGVLVRVCCCGCAMRVVVRGGRLCSDLRACNVSLQDKFPSFFYFSSTISSTLSPCLAKSFARKRVACNQRDRFSLPINQRTHLKRRVHCLLGCWLWL